MTPSPLFILADDFTGANDVGIPFARHGFETVVISDPDRLNDIDADIVILNTGSRDCSAEEAVQRVGDCVRAVQLVNGIILYKKVDSTLRGHIGIEIDTVAELSGHTTVILAPAFPETGRTTIGGYHLLNGEPVHNRSLFSDSEEVAFLPDLLGKQSKLEIRHLSLNTMLAGPKAVQSHLEEAVQSKKSAIVVADLVKTEEWPLLLDAVDSLEHRPLLCGSAGMAYPLAERIAASAPPGAQPPHPPHSYSGPGLVVAGSIHRVTIRQIRAAGMLPNTDICRINPMDLLDKARYNTEVERVTQAAIKGLNAGRQVIVALAPEEEADLKTWAAMAKAKSDSDNLISLLADRIAGITKNILKKTKPGGLVLTGGETAVQVVRHLDAFGSRIVEAIQQGVAVTTLLGGPYEGLPVITKPGGFGNEETISDALQHLQKPADIELAAERPVLGITIGDPNGVGPEVIVKTLSNPEIYRICRPLVIGHADVIRRHLHFTSKSLEVRVVDHPDDGLFEFGVIDVLNACDVDADDLVHGQVQKAAGHLAVESVIRATHLAMAGDTQAVVTAPLNKEAMNLAGYHYAGHTELLGELTGTDRFRLTLAFDNMLVSHVTTHVSLRQAIDLLSESEILATIEIIGGALKRMGIANPRIAVCGLNPHAGESGMFGDEEIRIINPALEKARAAGWHILGCLPPDTVFLRAQRGDFDGIVGMYHDQGHIPVKAIAFDRTVNVSLGMPIIRTSVDHGTAFDIAGKGVADAQNLGAAIRLAVRLVGDRWSVKTK